VLSVCVRCLSNASANPLKQPVDRKEKGIERPEAMKGWGVEKII